jgi:hypothetical protein
MSAYQPKDLDLFWRQNRLTAEQAVGQRSADLTPKPRPTCPRIATTPSRIGKTLAPTGTTRDAVSCPSEPTLGQYQE